MKKTLVSALTTALVVGAASTTFAAANPFSDVPADHWAYDAVAQLAQDGVINGYGDGTFRGQQEITRYEMAQMVAKAMAKTDVSAADKAMIDKLAAEFSDELNNLGVRVSNLEKKTDNVKWTGEVRYRFAKESLQGRDASGTDGDDSKRTNQVMFRVEPSAQVNENWTAKARIDYYTNADSDSEVNTSKGSTDSVGNGNLEVDRIYAEGVYGKTVIDLGKIPYFTNSSHGMVYDQRITGAGVTFGKDVRTTIVYGRSVKGGTAVAVAVDPTSTSTNYGSTNYDLTPSGSLLGIDINYDNGKKFTAGVGYNALSLDAASSTGGVDSMKIWNVGIGYRFLPTFNMTADYSKNTNNGTDYNSSAARGYNIQANYKGAVAANKGSFGIYAAYRNLGALAGIASTYDGLNEGYKGWELGTQYTFTKNIMGTLKYFQGTKMALTDAGTDHDYSKIFGQVEFFF